MASIRHQLNGGATDWIIRLVLGALIVWALSEISRMRQEVSDAHASVREIKATIEAMQRDVERLEYLHNRRDK